MKDITLLIDGEIVFVQVSPINRVDSVNKVSNVRLAQVVDFMSNR